MSDLDPFGGPGAPVGKQNPSNNSQSRSQKNPLSTISSAVAVPSEI